MELLPDVSSPTAVDIFKGDEVVDEVLLMVFISASYGREDSARRGPTVSAPLSPVVANYFMEKFEQQVVDQAVTKPKCWFRYVDDTFVIWPHGRDKLQEFLGHLNSINPRI
ncbi:hypothetical protein NQ315_013740 [Exocentrus adspersus]|uniref:Reverse transcriptase domain-containing protein n=1 Tax=Exocentrus adspersus TaxID=1586481 RepID=A0AAV8W426_9CUCU|nr:hypothetical protein NQ315_013740 [Exocentrus adspersus]